jgi:hypothetical protein
MPSNLSFTDMNFHVVTSDDMFDRFTTDNYVRVPYELSAFDAAISVDESKRELITVDE